MATSGRSTGKVPPDDFVGTVKWIYDDNQKSTLTNAWDRLVCRPKAHELGIPGIESSKAPDRNEFLRKAREFNSRRQDIEVHFLARGVQWGWRYDKGLSEIARGCSIELADVLRRDVWISSRTDTAAWKRLPEDQKRKLKSKIKELENQLLVGIKRKENIHSRSENTSTIRRIMPNAKHVKEALEKFEKGQVKLADIFDTMEISCSERGYKFVNGWKSKVEDILKGMTRDNV